MCNHVLEFDTMLESNYYDWLHAKWYIGPEERAENRTYGSSLRGARRLERISPPYAHMQRRIESCFNPPGLRKPFS